MRIPLPRLRARFLIAAVCAATVVATSVTVAAAAPVETGNARGETLVGTLVQAWTDDEDRTRSAEPGDGDPLSWIKPEDGDAVRVPTDEVDDLTVGDTVEVVLGDEVDDLAPDKGVEPAREVLASDVLEKAPATPDPPTAAATYPYHEVTVVMVVPPGGTPDGVTLADVVAEVNGPVAAFWSEQTHGDLAISVVAQHDWITTTADCTDPFALWDEVADTVGWNPWIGDGDHLLVYVSSAPSGSPGCSDGAGSTFGAVNSGGVAYVRDLSTSLIAHEFGHMFGLEHSASGQCTGPGFTGDCYTDEYGDLYDVMGYSWDQLGSLNVLQANRITWGVNDVSYGMGWPDRTVTLSPISQSSGYHAVVIDAAGPKFWLEYRPPSGRDAWLATGDNVFGLQSGVLLRQWWSDGSRLLDPTPSPMDGWADDLDVAMPVGTPVKLAGGIYAPGVITVTVQSMSPTGAVVSLSSELGDPGYDPRCEGRYRPNVPSSGVGMITVGGQTSALAVGTERALWLRPVDGAGGWQSLGGTSLYGPAGAVAGSTAYAFVVGGDQALWYRTNSGSGWGAWQTLGGRVTATPAAASLGPGHVRVFGRGGSGELWSREFRNGGWSAWMPHGGVLSGPPTASADVGAGLIRATVRGQDGSLFDLLFPEGGRTASYQVRDLVACSALAMTAVQSSADAGDGVFLDSAGQAQVLDLQVASGLGGGLTSNPAVVFGPSDVLVAGRGNDGALWLYDGRAGRNRWVSLGGRLL